MKRILICLFFLIFSTNLLANEPEYSNSLNENILEHGWKIKVTSNLVGNERSSFEVITLSKNAWILKCSLNYWPQEFYQRCWLP
mgnify:CR=1 FL=1|tara:strand:+ start:151 stop:402 length:252 start_codon:yes stop_codon:yes gene_type:complete